MKILGVQLDIAWEDKAANFASVRRLLAQAAPEPNTLVVLPEMFATGFSMNAAGVAEDYGGVTESFLSGLARQYQICLVAGVAMRTRSGRPRNKALAFAPDGRLVASYAKMRPFAPGGEGQHYEAGTKPATFSWLEATVSPFICYDLRFPELFRQAAALSRPELFLVLANWPEKRIAHWTRLLQARAIENQAYVAGINRVGRDPAYQYSGRSLIVDPDGEILADGAGEETVISARVDLDRLRKYRQGLPFLADLQAG